MKVVTQDSILHETFAIVLEITDEELKYISDDPSRFLTLDFDLMKRLMASKGNNAHIIQLTLAKGKRIIKYVTKLLEVYDSVSWFNPDNKFYIKRKRG